MLTLVCSSKGFAEQLFKHVEGMNERFEVKVMALDVISRLIGIHQLFIFNFYPYLNRFLQPHQRGDYQPIVLTVKWQPLTDTYSIHLVLFMSIKKTLFNIFVLDRCYENVAVCCTGFPRALATWCSRVGCECNSKQFRNRAEFRRSNGCGVRAIYLHFMRICIFK